MKRIHCKENEPNDINKVSTSKRKFEHLLRSWLRIVIMISWNNLVMTQINIP